ncbi:hypothetical protein [Streptomyces sp. SAJ15]|uniref:hypothetical protein n=1 Tax=Streptomyces sp. SAJ15 TaxID=2011095 RepID=UPI001185E1EB|nr:hypothetical protein [Streptomyces sp. SAJ15]TVL89828.1 hypothetical protein CD790_25890 [Streptomyces sp. SAJ15]
MKCGEPKPDSSYRTCDRELEHSGPHEYLGTQWARPKPAKPDWGMQELLEKTAPRDAWDLQERSFPIIVTETITRVLWVDAETEDSALAYWVDDWTDIPLKDTEVIEGSLEFERPDSYQRVEAFRAERRQSKIGPLVQCQDCGAEAFQRAWFHNPYRKCHGPIAWRETLVGALRDFQKTPMLAAARKPAEVAS